MNTVSVGSTQSWVNSTDVLSTTLEIVLLKKTIVLHWGQFIYAEGSDDEVHLAFGSHDVVVRGAGLLALLADVREQHVASIYEPTRTDRFLVRGECFIREIEVRRIDVN